MNLKFKQLFTNTDLKILAMIFMVMDHIPWILWSLKINTNIMSTNLYANVLHMFGRIAFPLFAYCIAEGYLHTHNLKKYTKRVGLLAFISIIPFGLMFGFEMGFIVPQNTIFTLFLGLCALLFSDKQPTLTRKFIVVFLCYILSIPADAGIDGGVLGIYAFAKIKNKAWRNIIGIFLLNYLDIFQTILNPSIQGLVELFWTIIPFLIITMLYNGKRGRNIKKFFYIFYPAHLLVLACTRMTLFYLGFYTFFH